MRQKKLYINITTILELQQIQIVDLLVPVIKDADRKSIFEISNEINELAVKARDGKLTSEEMKGGIMYDYEHRFSWRTMVYTSY